MRTIKALALAVVASIAFSIGVYTEPQAVPANTTTGVVYLLSISGSIPITAAKFGNGSPSEPSIAFASDSTTGFYKQNTGTFGYVSGSVGVWVAANNTSVGLRLAGTMPLSWASGDTLSTGADTFLFRDAANVVALRNGTNAQEFRTYGYLSGSRLSYGSLLTATASVTLSGASTATSNIIPAGATVVNVATTTTTAITGASGYQVGDGTDADRYGDITGTALGTASGSANGTADPRWWAASARGITLTAKTSNFTAGVVQVTVFYLTTTGA